MRIYSNFKDYYDVVRPFENDGVSYHRKTQELEKCPEAIDQLFELAPRLHDEANGIIGFCGKLYPFILREVNLYTYDDIAKLDRQLRKEDRYLHVFWGDRTFSRKTWTEYLLALARVDGTDIFRELDAPIFSAVKHRYKKSQVTINPRLNLLNFQGVIDPYQAYQEIAMYIGSTLARQVDPIIEIPDELKAQAHGYDKFSFRKMGKYSK